MAKGHQGKVAVVTGGANGIGQAFAQRLAADGVDVAVADVAPADETLRLVEQAGRRALAVECDVASPEAVVAMAAQVEARFRRCDILVNCAGIFPQQPFDAMSFADWRRLMAINLDSVFHVTQAVGARMLARGRGRIINICSVASELARKTIVPYAATKGAVRQITRGLSAEWAKRNIQINAIAPGYIVTELNRPLLDDKAFDAWVCARTPAGRWAEVDELAGAAIFLASDAASYVNGHVLYVDGGLSTSV